MDLRFHIDPETELPHIYEHGITEEEVRQVLSNPGDNFPGDGDSRIVFGQTWAGRYLQVIFVPDEGRESAFVITAYPLGSKTKKAYRRRRRRKP